MGRRIQLLLHAAVREKYLNCTDTYLNPGEAVPSSPTHPDKEELESIDPDGTDKNTKHWNLESLPYGALVVGGYCECYQYYTKLSGKSASDRRLKERIRELKGEESLELLEYLEPCSFTFRKSGDRAVGLIAQETPARFWRERGGYLGISYDEISSSVDRALQGMLRRVKAASHE